MLCVIDTSIVIKVYYVEKIRINNKMKKVEIINET